MSVAVGAVLRVVADHVFADNSVAQNVFNLVFSGSPTSQAEADVVSDLGDWLASMFTALGNTVDNEITAGEYRCYVFDAVDQDWDEIGSDAGTWVFNSASEMLPHGAAAVIDCLTTDPDVRGRKFIAGLTEGTQEASIIAASHLTNLAAFAAEWLGSYVGLATGGTFQPGVWSPTKGTFYAMLGTALINATIGYQRRRKPGVGI